MMRFHLNPPRDETELQARCQAIAGFSMAQLATMLDLKVPEQAMRRKGWVGQAIEMALGAHAGSHSLPDFMTLGVELKTIPINHLGRPAESTFITSIPLLTLHQQSWPTSQCFAKLRRVLWLPIEGDVRVPFLHRRIGQAVIWSPSPEEERTLCADWSELAFLITTGKISEVHAAIGEYLHVRPKAANAQSLCYGFDEQGNKVKTLPRGFYLRSKFTSTLITI